MLIIYVFHHGTDTNNTFLEAKEHFTPKVLRRVKFNFNWVNIDIGYWLSVIRYSTGCCPNHFSLVLKHLLINLRLIPGDSKTRPSGSNSWNRFSYTSPRFISKKRFNERSKRFSLGQQPVEKKHFILKLKNQ
jgi:hypothetical protein